MVFTDLFVVWDYNSLLLNVIISIGLLLVGIFLGKFISHLIKKGIESIDPKKEIRPSFVKLIVVVTKWSIYIIFLSFALKELPFPVLRDFVGEILLIIPAFVGSLILIGIGFAIAVYLRDIVEDSEIAEWKTLSQYLYYFVLYVFGIYALNLALIPIDIFIRNILIIVLTVVVGGVVTFHVIKK